MAENVTRILGIDPGLNITGYGVIEINSGQVTVLEAGVVRGKSRGSITKRVKEIYDGVTEVIESLKPTVMAMEELYSHYDRPKTAIIMGHARGVLCLTAAQADLELNHYAATQIKKILTGNGRASKQQMQLSIQRELGLPEIPEPADVADALAVAICHYYLSKTALSTT
ncbi:MAG: crossover junction endodeoxyribonuclease RuvC [Pirellulales bacterium]|jgi:crossover junction endodeoxyribonuclease RuvC